MGTGHSTTPSKWGRGIPATPSLHPGALSMRPRVSLAEYPKDAALEQPYTYINIYYI